MMLENHAPGIDEFISIPDVCFHSNGVNTVGVHGDFGQIVFHHAQSEHRVEIGNCSAQHHSKQKAFRRNY